jgi:hypothetical protein
MRPHSSPSPSGISRIVRGGIHRHAAVECDIADRDRDPGDDAFGKERSKPTPSSDVVG